MSYLKCEESAARLVMNLFIANPGPRHANHNLLNTIKIVNHAKEIAAFYQLDETSLCMLLTAAWFHEVGYLFGKETRAEQTSCLIMTGYLQTNEVAPELIEQACDCIRAVTGHPRLSRLMEKIMCDAVTYDYGTRYFRDAAPENPAAVILLLSNHVYYTEYCQLRLNQGKLENIQWLKKSV